MIHVDRFVWRTNRYCEETIDGWVLLCEWGVVQEQELWRWNKICGPVLLHVILQSYQYARAMIQVEDCIQYTHCTVY